MDPVAGIGLRSPHLAEIARERPATGFLEIHAENYLNGSQAVEALRADYALSIHAVGLSLGSVDGLDEAHLARVAALVKRLEPALVSDHLSWSSFGGRYFNDLLPLPYTEEALAVVVRNVQRLQEALGRQVSIENPSCYLGFAQSTLSEPEFLARARPAQRLRPAARRQQHRRDGAQSAPRSARLARTCRARRSPSTTSPAMP